MKTKTMKKALSLFIAVLMIALAMPFTLLTFADEAAEIEIANFSVFGRHSDVDQTKLFFNPSCNYDCAFDGDVGTEAQTKNGGAKGYEMCYFDADGKMTNGTNDSGASYYGIFIVELSSFADVDTLSLWGIDSWGFGWMSNDGYDIYYSADGESYTAVDGASFENVCAKQTTDDALYVGNSADGYVHDIAMGDVTAKYIAIAVSTPAYESCGYDDSDDGNHEMIFFEIVVTGTEVEAPSVEEPPVEEPPVEEPPVEEPPVEEPPVEEPPVVNDAVKIGIEKFSAFGNHLSADGLETPKVSFYASYPADAAFDGDIATDAQIDNNDTKGNLLYEMCFFNPDGVMTNGVNIVPTGKSYYVMFKIKLDGVASIDTLSLWTTYANPGTSAGDQPYMANNGYDIYYSADGEVYYAVDGASFEDVYAKQSTADALYVEGTYTKEDGTEQEGHVHEIDMGGVTAGYIVIAVSDLVSGADEAIVSEVVVMGTPIPEENEPDNGGSENGGSDNGGSDNGATDNGGSDNGGSDNGATDNSGSDNGATDNGGSDNGATDNGGSNNSGSNNSNTETDAPETDAKKGCGSSIAMSGVALVGTCAAVLAIKSKKKDEE